MSAPKHTPPPWRAANLSDGWTVLDSHSNAICFLGNDDSDTGGTFEADARLIASSPDLLASCVEFLPILERQLASINPGGAAEASVAYQAAKARVDRMRAAIARAEPTP